VLTYVARRLLLAVPVLLGVVFVVMLTVELIPGDAVALMLGEHATPEAVARLRDYLGLDKPLMVRYAAYVGHVARGDLGRSIQQNRPVVDELADAWPATLELTVAALVLAAAAGVAAGVVSAVWPNSLFDAVARIEQTVTAQKQAAETRLTEALASRWPRASRWGGTRSVGFWSSLHKIQTETLSVAAER